MRRLLTHAYSHVPFYRDKFEAAGIDPGNIREVADLQKLLVTTKRELRDNFPEKVTAQNISTKRFMRDTTSGSTGEPLTFYRDKLADNYSLASFALFDSWAGLRAGDKKVHFRAPTPEMRSVVRRLHNVAERRHMISVFELGENNAEKIALKLAKMKPKLMIGYSSAIQFIAQKARDKQIPLRPEVAICTGDTLGSKVILEQVFGCSVFNRYGNREICGGFAQNCPGSEQLHVNTEICILEIVDENGKAAKRGKIVLTDLNNYVMPFIRYDTGDIGTVSDAPCSCGRGFPLIESLEGRGGERLHLPSGMVISPIAIGHFCFVLNDWAKYFVKYQVIQRERDKIIFRFVPTALVDESVVSHVNNELRRFLGSDVSVSMDPVSDIPPEKSGKQPIIKYELL